ncbi:hypothetical protein ACLOJK_004077 [Asimina triloba]
MTTEEIKNYSQRAKKNFDLKETAIPLGDISRSVNNNEDVSATCFKGQENHFEMQYVVPEIVEKVMLEEH